MYVLGTSAIKYLSGLSTDTAIQGALIGKIAAFVGSAADRDGNPSAGTPGVLKSGLFVFLEEISTTPTTPGVGNRDCYLYETYQTVDGEWLWRRVGGNVHIPYQDIFAASGIVNAGYAFQHGPDASKAQARHIIGIPYYATDTKELYVYDGIQYMPVGSGGGGSSVSPPIGTMIVYATGITTAVPSGWTRCDGREESAAQGSPFYALAQVCGHAFGMPTIPGNFVLPLQDNFIIRYSYI